MTVLQANGAFHLPVTLRDNGKRLDVFMADNVASCSRNTAGRWIQDGRVQVDTEIRKPGYRVKTGEQVSWTVPAPIETDSCLPEAIPLDVIYEDRSLIVVNKPPGLVVHPAPGHPAGTLVNALMHHCPDIEGIGGELRPGIVHRLDKDTSGLIVAAKNQEAHEALALAFRNREVKKIYQALAYGCPSLPGGIVDVPIGRHPVDRKRMCVPVSGGRNAETHWQVIWCHGGVCCLDLDLKTGRTHQIRVHMEHIGHPLVGDPVYNRNTRRWTRRDGFNQKIPKSADRQMLHARYLSFLHPFTQKLMRFHAIIPADMESVMQLACSGCPA